MSFHDSVPPAACDCESDPRECHQDSWLRGLDRRLWICWLAAALAGMVATWGILGGRSGAGFMVGALLAGANLRLLQRVADQLLAGAMATLGAPEHQPSVGRPWLRWMSIFQR